MKHLVPATIAAVLTVGTFLGLVYAAGSFNQKLSPNQQIIHALNRLTFGPHPVDVEEVRRIGLAKWIELQLHPDRIQENPVLEGKLKPLATLNMSMADVVREYTPQAQGSIGRFAPECDRLYAGVQGRGRRTAKDAPATVPDGSPQTESAIDGLVNQDQINAARSGNKD